MVRGKLIQVGENSSQVPRHFKMEESSKKNKKLHNSPSGVVKRTPAHGESAQTNGTVL